MRLARLPDDFSTHHYPCLLQGDEIDWGVVGSYEKWELLCDEISTHLNFLYTHTYKGG